MPTAKPFVEQEQMLALLQEHFGHSIVQLTEVKSGQVARTFSFAVDGQEYIIQFSAVHVSFEKEVYAYNTFASPMIPIPRIVKIGRLPNDVRFAISLKVPGKPLNQLSWQENEQLVPQHMTILDSIHSADIRGHTGAGVWDGKGVGLFPTWKEYLTFVMQEETSAWGFFGRWHTLFTETFLERDLFESVYQRMVQLLDYCPEEDYLVHGGYGLSNVLAHEGTITAVLDWTSAMYGDFLYDIAWLDVWVPEMHIAERFHRYYVSRQVTVPAYAERVRCYQCYISLDALRFFAKIQNHASYQWIKDRIQALLQ
jgi:hygromycin-B 4-O-kinase